MIKLAAIATPVLVTAIKVLVGLLIAAVMLIGLQQCRMDNLRDKLAAERAALGVALDANKTNIKAIGVLEAANAEWAARHAADTQAADKAAERERQRAATIAADLARTRTELEGLYGTPECEAWAAARMCRAPADRMWPNEGRRQD